MGGREELQAPSMTHLVLFDCLFMPCLVNRMLLRQTRSVRYRTVRRLTLLATCVNLARPKILCLLVFMATAFTTITGKHILTRIHTGLEPSDNGLCLPQKW